MTTKRTATPRPDVVSVTLDAPTRALLDARVAATGQTRSEVVRDLIAAAPPVVDTDALLADVRARVARLEAWQSDVARWIGEEVLRRRGIDVPTGAADGTGD